MPEKVQKKQDQNCLSKKAQKNQFQAKMFMDNKSLVLMAAKACDDKKAKDIKLIKRQGFVHMNGY